jgi:type II secretory pathway component PulF
MPTFHYTARTRDGRRAEGTLEAADRYSALWELQRRQLIPVRVNEGGAPVPGRPTLGERLRRGARRRSVLSLRALLQFTQELSDLLSSGMTLGEALHAMARRASGGATATALITDLRDQIIRGSSLSDALASHPETFPPLYVSMVRAGEAAGSLAEALERLVRHYQRAQETRERIIMALTYPAIVLTVGGLTVVFIMVVVIPRFAAIFAELGSTLPLPTRILIGFSRTVTGVRGLVLLAMLAAAGIAIRRTLKSEQGREWWHRMQLRLPLIREVAAAAAYTQFAQTLGSLLANGVPVLQALSIVEHTVGNRVIAREIREARQRVTDGSTISGPLAAGKVFPPLLTDMLAVGERTGDMTGALNHIARHYEAQLDRTLKLFLTVLEPLLIVTIATIVGFVAISMLAAVFDLTSGLKA